MGQIMTDRFLTVILEKDDPLYAREDFSDFTHFQSLEFLYEDSRDNSERLTEKINAKTTHLLLDAVIPLEKRHLDRLEKLEYIGTAYTGWWDKYFDVAEIERRSIRLSVNRGYATNAVAEAVFTALLLNCRSGLAGGGGEDDYELKGRKMAIMGKGRIGKRVEAISRGFGMDALFYDRRGGNPDFLPDDVDVFSINVPKSAGPIVDGGLLAGCGRLRAIVNSSGWENVEGDDLREFLAAHEKCVYIHIAYPDREREKKFEGLGNVRFHPLFSNNTLESRRERKEAPLRELRAYCARGD